MPEPTYPITNEAKTNASLICSTLPDFRDDLLDPLDDQKPRLRPGFLPHQVGKSFEFPGQPL